jgi:hypothetical protein
MHSAATYAIAGLSLEDCMPEFNAMDLAGRLAHELGANHQAMPDSTKHTLLLVAACLFKLAVEVGMSRDEVATAMMKMQATKG